MRTKPGVAKVDLHLHGVGNGRATLHAGEYTYRSIVSSCGPGPIRRFAQDEAGEQATTSEAGRTGVLRFSRPFCNWLWMF